MTPEKIEKIKSFIPEGAAPEEAQRIIDRFSEKSKLPPKKPIFTFLEGPNPLLRLSAPKFPDKITKKMRKNIKRLCDFLIEDGRCAGIAAPQVGINERFLVIKQEGEEPLAVLDPKIIWTSDDAPDENYSTPEGNPIPKRLPSWEGCLSLPGRMFLVTRPNMIKVRFLTPKGVEKCMTVNGIVARVFQHEIDHLNGVMIDKIAEKESTANEEESKS